MAKRVKRTDGSTSKADLKIFIKNYDNVITEAYSIIEKANLIHKGIQKQLFDLGFSLVFRGFNSHSADIYIYEYNGLYNLSFGMSNINLAGRGLEIQVELTKEGLEHII